MKFAWKGVFMIYLITKLKIPTCVSEWWEYKLETTYYAKNITFMYAFISYDIFHF